MILLDSNAVIWLLQGNRRARMLERAPRLYISPSTVLEMQILAETGRLRLPLGALALAEHPRWLLDEPPAMRWFAGAAQVSWTRDPFDRLIVAHARVRGWKLATGDRMLLDQLAPNEALPL